MNNTRSSTPETPKTNPSGVAVLRAFPGLKGVNAFFTTRRGGFSAPPYASLNLGFRTGDDAATVGRNWQSLLEAESIAGEPVIPRLCHGAALVDADIKSPGEIGLTEADAVFTRAAGRVIAVTTADCLGALVFDPAGRCAAAVHAGWRGTRENILGHALSRLFAEGWCDPATTHVALGPCLSPAALELGEDIASTLPPQHIVRFDGRPHFDLRACNRAQALAAGVHPRHVSVIGGCTFAEPDLYFSHRRSMRDGTGATGRLAACISLI